MEGGKQASKKRMNPDKKGEEEEEMRKKMNTQEGRAEVSEFSGNK